MSFLLISPLGTLFGYFFSPFLGSIVIKCSLQRIWNKKYKKKKDFIVNPGLDLLFRVGAAVTEVADSLVHRYFPRSVGLRPVVQCLPGAPAVCMHAAPTSRDHPEKRGIFVKANM